MTTFAIAQLAAQRRQELIAEATEYRQSRTRRAPRRPRTSRRTGSGRRIVGQARSAFQAWYAAGEL
jgi:hypothetical protein